MKAGKSEIVEPLVFSVCLLGFFSLFAIPMGMANMLNTMMETAYDLLLKTCFYLTAICVLTGALSALLAEFGVVGVVNRLLSSLLKPLYGLPGAASLGVVTTFLSDNPAILTLANDRGFRKYFKKYQLPALTNLGTAFGMGLIICTFMISLQGKSATGESYALPVLVGLLGAVVGSIVSVRIMLHFTKKLYGTEEPALRSASEVTTSSHVAAAERPKQALSSRFLNAMLNGGKSGIKMGAAIVPGVLIICTLVMMLTNGPDAETGQYTGAAYEGIRLLPWIADKCEFFLKPLFGFSSGEAIAVPVTALGAAGAAIGLVDGLLAKGLIQANDIAVFTAMCMCWSGYLSTHVSMMNSLKSNELIGRAIFSHTIGGLCAGVSANWLYVVLNYFF
jgi:ABC-type cobalt transport system substrate-binding protein